MSEDPRITAIRKLIEGEDDWAKVGVSLLRSLLDAPARAVPQHIIDRDALDRPAGLA